MNIIVIVIISLRGIIATIVVVLIWLPVYIITLFFFTVF